MKNFLFLFRRKKNIDQKFLLKSRALISGVYEKQETKFQQKIFKDHLFVEMGVGQPLIFCYGLLGSFRNFEFIANQLAKNYRIIVPYLPMYDMPIKDSTVHGLSLYLEKFINDLEIKNCILVGNSMGGGTVLRYTLRNLNNVEKLILFSSSGLSFIPMRSGFLKIKQYTYIKELLQEIFYDSSLATEDEVREIYDALQKKETLLRCISFTRSTRKDLLHDELKKITIPTLVIWGKNDTVTPCEIGHEFHQLLPNSELKIIPKCGHCPPFEQSEICAETILKFLSLDQ